MNFNDMQKLWQQQEDNTVFRINDYLLREVLAQKRKEFHGKIRREWLWGYSVSSFAIAGLAFMFLAMWFDNDPRTSADFVAVIIAAVSLFYWMIWHFLQRKRLALAERQYTASVKDEITRGIMAVDFEIALRRDVPKLLAGLLPIHLTGFLILWAGYRINNSPIDATIYGFGFVLIVSFFCCFRSFRQEVTKRFLPRKRELEQLRAKLTEEA